ncbi:MAG: DNA-3-methyladenine glycosylase [Phycisphaerales bacterium]
MRARRSFFSADSPTLAQRLLGATLVRVLDDGARLAGVIVETEAYIGPEDTCAHSVGGRRTERTEPMYAKPGTAYVYFTYGMHHCVNVVAGEVNQPVAVLIRALEPTEGLDIMRALRSGVTPDSLSHGGGGFQPPHASNEHQGRGGKMSPPPKGRQAVGGANRSRILRDTDLCSGPGKICQALAIDRSLSGIDLTNDPRLFVEPSRAGPIDPVNLVNDARIGVGDADEWARAPLRWHVRGNPHVSVVRTPRSGVRKRPRVNRE